MSAADAQHRVMRLRDAHFYRKVRTHEALASHAGLHPPGFNGRFHEMSQRQPA